MKLLFVVLAVLGWTSGFAERIYALFETGCGTRIEYDLLTDQGKSGTYFVHSLPLNSERRLLLESDAAGVRSLSSLPDDYINCGAVGLSPDLADRINSGDIHFFIIEASDDGGYREHPVLMAALLSEEGNRISYESPMVTLAFDKTNAVIGDKLPSSTPATNIMFEGREGVDCASPYLLHQQTSNGAYSAIDLKLFPGVGLLERQLTSGDGSQYGGSIVATEIDGRSVKHFLLSVCQPQPELLTYSDRQRDFVPHYVDPVPRMGNLPGDVQPRAVESYVTTHTVKTGETLYGISRLHGIGVTELKRINGLTENTIFVGQLLRVGGETTGPSGPVGVTQAPYTIPDYPQSNIRDQAYYTAKTGETLASIAYRSGYTKERFAEFNGLEADAIVRPGQRLKTSHCDVESATWAPPGPVIVEVPEKALPRPGDYLYSPPSPAMVPEAGNAQAVVPPPAYGGSSEQTVTQQSNIPAERRQMHIVKDGENLYGIARQYRVSVPELRALNYLPTDVIVPFQELYLN